MIEDRELSQIFQAESEEYLRTLEDGLLALESEPTNRNLLEEVFRAAHSLKGNARMLGLGDLETSTHVFEESLGAVRRGQSAISSEMVDSLCRGVDTLRRQVNEAITGSPSPVMIAPPVPVPLPPIAPTPVELDPLPPPPQEETTKEPVVAPGAFKIETIRVEPEKLDRLMTIAGELTVTTSRVARGSADWEALVALREDWGRKLQTQRLILNDVDSQWKTQSSYKRLLGLYEQDMERLTRLDTLLARMKQLASEDVARLETITGEMSEAIQNVRLLPFSTIFGLFPRLVRDLVRTQGKEADLLIEGAETVADKRILEEMKDPLMHMIRNGIDHGLESPEERIRQGKPRVGTMRLRAFHTASNVVIELTDDGRGLDLDAIRRTALKRSVCREEDLAAMNNDEIRRLIFEPGFSTSPIVTDVSGRGVGMDVVHANVEKLKGSIHITSEPGKGSCFRIHLPLTLATTRVLLIQSGGQSFALPVDSVQTILLVSSNSIFRAEGRDTICHNGEPVSMVSLAKLLQIPEPTARPRQASFPTEARQPCILIHLEGQVLGILVDTVIDEQQVLIKPLGPMLRRVNYIAGATILGTGTVCLVLNPQDLIKGAKKHTSTVSRPRPTAPTERVRKTILLSEDSITTRTQEKRILENAGYNVVTAVDGLDAFQKLGTGSFDAVVSDVEMPNMDGWTLATRIRAMPQYKELPIVLVTSLASDEDRKRGVEVGASAYITKGTFDQKTLVEALRRLV